MTKLDQDPDLMLKKISKECQRIVNLKHDNTRIEERTFQVHNVNIVLSRQAEM